MNAIKSFASAKVPYLYAISCDKEYGTVDITFFDHDTGAGATLYLPPSLAKQLAESIVHHVQLLSE